MSAAAAGDAWCAHGDTDEGLDEHFFGKEASKKSSEATTRGHKTPKVYNEKCW